MNLCVNSGLLIKTAILPVRDYVGNFRPYCTYLSTSPRTKSIVDIKTTKSCIPKPLIMMPPMLNRAIPTELIEHRSIMPATIRLHVL